MATADRSTSINSGERSWQCPSCTVINDVGVNVCHVCERLRSSWQCTSCTLINDVGVTICHVCQKFSPPSADDDLDAECEAAPRSCRMILLGKTGSGKSSTGNTVLGRIAFHSKASPASVTRECLLERAVREGKTIQVVDTPGMFDTGFSNEDITREITTCVRKSVPGPHAFILVTRLGRFTAEEKQTFDTFEKILGEDMYRYAIVLFTRKDDIDSEGMTFQQYIEDSPPVLCDILRKCEMRCLAFNNKGSVDARDEMCRDLLRMIDSLMAANHGSCYTNALYEKAEHAMTEKTRKTMEECATDRSLPTGRKWSQRRLYENDIQLFSAQLESLAMIKSSEVSGQEVAAIKVALLEMQVKQKSLELELNKATMGNDELKRKVEKQDRLVKRLRREHIDEKKDESNWSGLVEFTKIVLPFVVPVFRMFGAARILSIIPK